MAEHPGTSRNIIFMKIIIITTTIIIIIIIIITIIIIIIVITFVKINKQIIWRELNRTVC